MVWTYSGEVAEWSGILKGAQLKGAGTFNENNVLTLDGDVLTLDGNVLTI